MYSLVGGLLPIRGGGTRGYSTALAGEAAVECVLEEVLVGTPGTARVLECAAAAAWPRAARAVLSCAGAYVSGADGSNACPAGSARIETEAACRTAAAAAGKTFFTVVTESYTPRGCYYETTTNYAAFNAHAVGAGYPDRQLLCAVATTGAPFTPMRSPARVHRHCACVCAAHSGSSGRRRCHSSNRTSCAA